MITNQAAPNTQPGGVQGALFKPAYHSLSAMLPCKYDPKAKPPKLNNRKSRNSLSWGFMIYFSRCKIKECCAKSWTNCKQKSLKQPWSFQAFLIRRVVLNSYLLFFDLFRSTLLYELVMTLALLLRTHHLECILMPLLMKISLLEQF